MSTERRAARLLHTAAERLLHTRRSCSATLYGAARGAAGVVAAHMRSLLTCSLRGYDAEERVGAAKFSKSCCGIGRRRPSAYLARTGVGSAGLAGRTRRQNVRRLGKGRCGMWEHRQGNERLASAQRGSAGATECVQGAFDGDGCGAWGAASEGMRPAAAPRCHLDLRGALQALARSRLFLCRRPCRYCLRRGGRHESRPRAAAPRGR